MIELADTNSLCSWLLLHRVDFGRPVDGAGQPFPAPANAAAWRFYPASSGDGSAIASVWGGLSIYTDRGGAEKALCELSEAPWLQSAVEAWHAVAVPYYHHGTTNWLGELRDGTTLVVSKADPGGPLAVLTSVGYANPGPADMERIGNFMSMVMQLVEHYRKLPGNLASAAFSGVRVDGLDGTTLTIWADDTAMRNAAYRPGLHRDQMTKHRSRPFFDRSSFTRARIVSSIGSWNGMDPVKGAAVTRAATSEPIT